MKINNLEVVGNKFAYDDCHKIYIIEDDKDFKEAQELDYTIYKIDKIMGIYQNSCPLRFISNWKLDKNYVYQYEKAVFEIDDEKYVVVNEDIFYDN